MLAVVLHFRYEVNQDFRPLWSVVVQPGAPALRIAMPSSTWVSAWDISSTPSLRPVVWHGTTWPKFMFGFIWVAELRNQVRRYSSARVAYPLSPVYHQASVRSLMPCQVFAQAVRSPVVATVGPQRPSFCTAGHPSAVSGFGHQ